MPESSLLRHIAARSADLPSLFGDVVLGPGDDCAIIATPSGDQLLITVDQLVEGRHWNADAIGNGKSASIEEEARDGSPHRPPAIALAARKAIARSVSDIAAMGGRPCWGLATGLLPDGFEHGDDLFDAMAAWARRWNCPLIGGDIAFGPGPLSLTVTVAGRMDPGVSPVLRRGATPGDALYLTGPIGGSYQSNRHLLFQPRTEAGAALAASGRARAMIDLSDGLGRDAARVGEASGVRLVIDTDKLPINENCAGWLDAVSEGEDYELLVALSPGDAVATAPALLGPIGRAEEGTPGAVFIDPYGESHDAANLGWDHGAQTRE
ncbi:MAG: thiamine-phosphate kinase [Planctomycetota bacterium]